jgi:hypothetical protein
VNEDKIITTYFVIIMPKTKYKRSIGQIISTPDKFIVQIWQGYNKNSLVRT